MLIIQYMGFWLCALTAGSMAWVCLRRARRLRLPFLLVVAAGTGMLVWNETICFKTFLDDIGIACTAKGLATELKQNEASGINLEGKPVFEYLDKRPALPSFLGAVVRTATPLLVPVSNRFVPTKPLCVAYANALLLGPLFIGAFFWLARKLSGPCTAAAATLIAASLPLAGHVFTGGGLEPAYLVGLVLSAGFLLEGSTNALLVALAWTALSRYEGAFVAGGVLLYLLWRRQIPLRSLGVAALPVLALLHTFVVVRLSHVLYPQLFQENHAGAGEMFGLGYVLPNLLHQFQFLFTLDARWPNTPAVAFGAVWALLLSLQAGKVKRLAFLLLFAVTPLCLLPYFWGNATEAIVWRLMLPELIALVLVTVYGASLLPSASVRFSLLGAILLSTAVARTGHEYNAAIVERLWIDKQIQGLVRVQENSPLIFITDNPGWPGLYNISGDAPEYVHAHPDVFRRACAAGIRFFMVETVKRGAVIDAIPGTHSRVLASQQFPSGLTLRLVEKTP